MVIGFGLLFLGQSEVTHAISTEDVTLTYLNESGLSTETIADFAYGSTHDPSSSSPLEVIGLGSFNGSYDFILKLDTDEDIPVSSAFSSYVDGVSFAITDLTAYEVDEKPKGGTFTLEWTGSSLPAYFDLVFGFGIGETGTDGYSIAYYGFDELYLSKVQQNATGSYLMTFKNPGGQTANASHLIMYGKQGDTPIPEPATMLLFGTGLAGLAAVGRRRKN